MQRVRFSGSLPSVSLLLGPLGFFVSHRFQTINKFSAPPGKDPRRRLPKHDVKFMSEGQDQLTRHAPSLAVFGSFGSMPAWREGAMHQRSFNKIILHYILGVQNSDELRQPSQHNFIQHVWHTGLQSFGAIVSLMVGVYKTTLPVSSPAETRFKTRGKNLVS